VFFFLRLIGITNAALWFGSAISVALIVGPAFSSSEMLRILPRSHSGAAAQVVVSQFFVLQYWCGGVALAHLLSESLYAGKPWKRWNVFLVAALFGLQLLSGLVVEPKLQRLHLEIYGIRSTPRQREFAGHSFRLWQGVLQTSNLLVAIGLWGHLWEIGTAKSTAKFVTSGKFRG